MAKRTVLETDASEATAKTKSHVAPAINPALVDALKIGFGGQLILPDDTAYEKARRIWNASIDKHPAMIARCSGVADIASAIAFARANGLPASVRGVGTTSPAGPCATTASSSTYR